MAEYKQIHKVEVEKKPFTLTKKMIALLVIAIVLVVGVIAAYIVTADKDGYTSSVQNSSSEVISGDVSVTKKGLYEYLLDNYGANEVLNEAYNKITAKEITDKDAINTKVKELKQRYAEYSGFKGFETTFPGSDDSFSPVNYIKNGYSFGTLVCTASEFNLNTEGVVNYAMKQGTDKNADPFDFLAKIYCYTENLDGQLTSGTYYRGYVTFGENGENVIYTEIKQLSL